MNSLLDALVNPLVGACIGAIAAFALWVLVARVNGRQRVAGILKACQEHVQREHVDIQANLQALQHSSDALAGLIGALDGGSSREVLTDNATYQEAIARAMNISVNYFVPGRWTLMLGADISFVEANVFSAIATLESYVEFVNANANQVLKSARDVIAQLGHGSLVRTFDALEAMNTREHGAVLALLHTHQVNVLLYTGLVGGLQRHFEATTRLLEQP